MFFQLFVFYIYYPTTFEYLNLHYKYIMNLIKDIIGNIAAPIKAIGDVIDQTSTSDEEKLTLKNESERILNSFFTDVIDRLTALEAQITARHDADMKSDSWLSKNVRPMILIYLTIIITILAFLVIFTITDASRMALITPWIDLLKDLLQTVFVFYFGSRGIEKGIKMVSDAWTKKQTAL